MRIELNTGKQSLAFIALVLVLSALYIGSVGRHCFALRLASQPNPISLVQAANLEPLNADLKWKLGRYVFFAAQDPTRGLVQLNAAVGLNPHVAQYWLDLASVYHVIGDVQRQSSALEHALHDAPTDPSVAWEVANFYLARDDLARALPLFRVVMKNNPEQLSSALTLCWRAAQNVKMMLDEAVPAEPEPLFAFLKLLTDRNETAAAGVVWTRLINLNEQFPFPHAFPYFDYLIKKHETAAAEQVWQQLIRKDIQLQPYSQPANLIVDGGLERDFLNGGFGWRYAMIDPVHLAMDTGEFWSGNQSLRITFKGPPVEDIGIFEYVPAHPDAQYHFSVYSKAEDIESASGPRLSVRDAYSAESYVLTDDSLGTTSWKQQSADFRTGPQTSLLIVKVTRIPADPLIKGTFWIDDVKLVQR